MVALTKLPVNYILIENTGIGVERMAQIVGTVLPRVISLLGIDVEMNQPIYLGSSNISHMQNRHPDDYARYGACIPQILAAPDYVGENPRDGSIEYVKEFQIEGEYVKVAVRLSGHGTLYARSLYVLNPNRVQNFIRRGTLKKV